MFHIFIVNGVILLQC